MQKKHCLFHHFPAQIIFFFPFYLSSERVPNHERRQTRKFLKNFVFWHTKLDKKNPEKSGKIAFSSVCFYYFLPILPLFLPIFWRLFRHFQVFLSHLKLQFWHCLRLSSLANFAHCWVFGAQNWHTSKYLALVLFIFILKRRNYGESGFLL